MINTIVFDMYGVIIKESKGRFIPYVYEHFPNTDKSNLLSLFTKTGLGQINSPEFLYNLGFEDTKYHMKNYILR